MLQKEYYVYILTNKERGTLYVGITNDLSKRLEEHRTKNEKSFTTRYGLHTLVYYEIHEDVNDAILREKQMKRWRRNWKIELIESQNPKWLDLSLYLE